MRFDRTAPGGGVEVNCRYENRKVYLEWDFFIAEEDGAGKGDILSVLIRDRQGDLALECLRSVEEEEPMRSVLLQPHLWNGIEDPYLYTLEAFLMDRNGLCRDRLTRQLALYQLTFQGELFLNGVRFEEKVVRYILPEAEIPAQLQRAVAEDLKQIREMGANCIYVERKEALPGFFFSLCERLGFLVRPMRGRGEMTLPPAYRGEPNSLVSREGIPRAEFFRYKAKWSSKPFVYLVPESVRRQENGSFYAVVYSNCARIALYSDGILHEFQSGSCEFAFREIPARGPYLSLVAEAEGCRSALTIQRSLIPAGNESKYQEC